MSVIRIHCLWGHWQLRGYMDHTHFFLTAFTAMSRGKEMNGCSSMFSKIAAVKFFLVVIACLHMHIVHRQNILIYSLNTERKYLLKEREPNWRNTKYRHVVSCMSHQLLANECVLFTRLFNPGAYWQNNFKTVHPYMNDRKEIRETWQSLMAFSHCYFPLLHCYFLISFFWWRLEIFVVISCRLHWVPVFS